MAALLMHKSLWLLVRLSAAARLRAIRRLTKTWKGRFALLIMLFGIAMIAIGSLVGPVSTGLFAPETVRNFGALALAGMVFGTMLFSGSEGGIAFTPPEVEFLFPAPIPRRHLLIHRIVVVVLVTLPTSVFIGCTFQRNTPTFLGAWLGAWLSFSMLSLSQMAWQLLTGIAAQATVARSKKAIALGLVLVVVAALASGALGMQLSYSNVSGFAESGLGRTVLFPFRPFSSVLAAANVREIATNGGVCLGILFAQVLLILKLDSNQTEASWRASQRLAKQVQDMKQGRIPSRANGFLQRFGLPMLPRFHGAGPIAWHQLTAALRSAGHLSILIAILCAVMIAPFAFREVLALRQMLLVMISMSIFMLPQFIQYDFRAEVDRMPVLKSLPLAPLAIVVGELLAPMLITLFIQLVLIGLAALTGGVDARVLLLMTAFLVPIDALIYTAENFVFLLFPIRISASSAQDLQTMLRVMMTMLLKVMVVCALLGVAGGLGALAYYVSDSKAVGFCVAWVCVSACCLGLLPALAWAFRRFDPALDVPT